MIRLAALRQYRHPPTSELRHAMQPWARRLALESFGRWLVRGAVAALVVMCAVLSIGWLLPVPMNDLQPIALELALPVALLGAIVGLWPASTLRRAAQLDTRLNFADRLATAWLLQKEHRVTVFESQNRLGGHAHTVDVDIDGMSVPVVGSAERRRSLNMSISPTSTLPLRPSPAVSSNRL